MTDPNKTADIPFRVTNPERIPAQRYYDEEFYRLECEKLWPKAWQMACRLEQIPNVGDWVEYSNVGKSVLVVRTSDGVKAYHNACRHRGVKLNDGAHGNCASKGFICPFHGWRWDINGKNTFVYGRHMFGEGQLGEADLALKPCRIELAIGCAFINFDDDAVPFRETIGTLMDKLDVRNTENLRTEWWYATILPANWKVAMEAFMEGYHTMKTHPQLQKAAPVIYNSLYGYDTGGIGELVNPDLSVRDNVLSQLNHLDVLSRGMAGMIHAKEVAIAQTLGDVDLPEDPMQAVPMWYGIVQDQIFKQLSAKGEAVPDLNAAAVSHPINPINFLFPHYFLLPFFTSMASYRIRPLGPESCLFELWSLTHFAEGEAPEPPQEPIMLDFDGPGFPDIPRQDYSNIPRQQQGLHSEGFEFMRLSKDIEGLLSNYQRVIDGYLAGADKAKLAKASAELGNNFDGQILELDL